MLFYHFFYILQKCAISFSFFKVYRTHHVWLLTFPWKCFYSFMISSPYLPNWSPNYIYSVTNIKWKEETPGKRDQFTFWGRNMCKKWRKFGGIVSFAAHMSFWPKLIFKSIWQSCSELIRLQNKFRFKSNTYGIDVFFVKALANKKSKELWFKMNFKAVKHHSAFLRDKISFLELSSHSVTSWAENWLWQGESTAMSASLWFRWSFLLWWYSLWGWCWCW